MVRVVRKPKRQKRRTKINQSDVPTYSLSDAIRVAAAIVDNLGSSPSKSLQVAQSMNLSPNSSTYRKLTGASVAYGLTTGGWNSDQIAITELAKRLLRPTDERMDGAAKKDALLKPRVIREFLEKYNNSPVPRDDIAHNVLEEMGVPGDRAADVYKLIQNGANYVGLITTIKGKEYFDLHAETISPASTNADEKFEESPQETIPYIEPSIQQEHDQISDDDILKRKRNVFLAHGKDKAFLEPVRKLLSFGELNAVVSVDNSTVSIPIPDKVMTDMRSCGAAIIHIKSEGLTINPDGDQAASINPNVLIEIGAAMALYGKRFILLVKTGVQLPSNLQGLSEVRYEGDSLDLSETVQLLEAIGDIKNHPLPGER